MQSYTGQHSPTAQFYIVYIWITKFHAIIAQYIGFYFNIKITTFVGFQIAVYTYVVLNTFTYLHTLCCVLLLDNTLY